MQGVKEGREGKLNEEREKMLRNQMPLSPVYR